MPGLNQPSAASVEMDASPDPTQSRRVHRVPGSFPEAGGAPGGVEARLGAALRAQQQLQAENRRLGQSLEAAVRRAEAARRIALYDVPTGLPNRHCLMERLASTVASAEGRHGRMALLFIDLDGFKAINDRLGHAVGDRLLAAVASRIAACVRTDDIACRYGGDEFVALLSNLGDESVAFGIAQKVRDRIAGDFAISGHRIRITASIGLAIHPQQGAR